MEFVQIYKLSSPSANICPGRDELEGKLIYSLLIYYQLQFINYALLLCYQTVHKRSRVCVKDFIRLQLH
jgi:hypothetical protein